MDVCRDSAARMEQDMKLRKIQGLDTVMELAAMKSGIQHLKMFRASLEHSPQMQVGS